VKAFPARIQGMTPPKEYQQPQRLFWIDLEMTGLDVQKEVIIECAALVTDFDFNIIAQYEAVVHQPQKYLDSMDDWNRTHHTKSGLVGKIPFGDDPKTVENYLLGMLQKHFDLKKERPILAGNSIAQDRAFIEKYWPTLHKTLHYRMMDVTAWKIIFNSKYALKYEKKNGHRALDDVKESLAELKFYLSRVKPA
jgi:oligoribonuclease